MKKKVGIIIGGKTVEHEVSIVTGLQVLDNIDKSKYEPYIIYIDKDGKWFIGEDLHNINNYKNKAINNKIEVVLSANDSKLVLYPHPENRSKGLFTKKQKPLEIDIIFPAVHGTNTEDGTLHGFFEMNNISCAFGTVLSSSVGMDKIIMKKVFQADNLPIVDYIWFYRNEWINENNTILENVNKIGYPLIVKPSNLGSSIGIGIANTEDELIESIEVAIRYSNKVIVEKCIENAREINCAVLGYEDKLSTSLCEEPLGWAEFLTYEDKYVNKSKGQSGQKRKLPAEINEETTKQIENYAKKAFKAIDSSGTSRIDFLYDGNNIYVNEINTIPGSIAFYLWEATGISFKELITKILDIAEMRKKQKIQNITTYDIDLLNNMSKNGKNKL